MFHSAGSEENKNLLKNTELFTKQDKPGYSSDSEDLSNESEISLVDANNLSSN